MADGNPKRMAPTVALESRRQPTAVRVRPTMIVADVGVDLAPESLARTIGATDALMSADQVKATLPAGERYIPIRELGRGGMGRVDVIFDRALGRAVARKVALAEHRHAALLIAEAQICAQLEHPSIVPVYDVGADAQGNPHYTMRVVRGRTLGDVLDDNEDPEKPHLALAQLLGILRQVCLAVDYAHSRGVVHRDLKPQNIIVGEFGEVYVLDWGVAYVTEGSDIHRTTPKGIEFSVAGSPGYMAPEQAMGEAIEARTDVFALGVILYEVLTGVRPFDDKDLPSILRRIAKSSFAAPSLRARDRGIGAPASFDDLVTACLARRPGDRPASARLLADAIDAFLDGERVRSEREREAATHAAEGELARSAFEDLSAQARALEEKAELQLSEVRPWEPVERKQDAWALGQQARRLAAEAARALARAEAAFTRALGRVADHVEARRGLAGLYYRQFEAAEARGNVEKMAQYLDLARAYDDGTLALELADRGELVVESLPGTAQVCSARFELSGLLLVPGEERDLGAARTAPAVLESGSYLLTARGESTEVRFPVVIERARAYRVRLLMRSSGEVPPDMVLILGGPFLALPPRATRLVSTVLPDFAIGRFPVTLREYVSFLESIVDPDERQRRTPGYAYGGGPLLLLGEDGRWTIAPRFVEGEARKRVPHDHELDLPVMEVSWYDAAAYAGWLGGKTGLAYRLPTDLEWDKAMRGADGRAFPMGNHLDPSFAKIRESRPEASQPEPVGAFVHDVSPYGVRDLAGGVGDWTSTSVDGAPLPDLAEEGDARADERQAYWRGGHWGAIGAVRGLRYSTMIRHRNPGVGFRLALSLSLDQNGSSDLVVEPMKRG